MSTPVFEIEGRSVAMPAASGATPLLKRKSTCVILALLTASITLFGIQGGSVSSGFVGTFGLAISAVKIAFLVLFLVILALVGLILGGESLIAKLVKDSIENYDRQYIGVDVTIEQLTVSIRHGIVDIKNLVVSNYQGYDAEYLMKVDRAVADLNTWLLVCSGAKEIEVERLIFQGVDVIWEQSGMSHSNVKEVMNFISNGGSTPTNKPESNAPAEPTPPPEPAAEAAPSGRTVSLRVVKFEDIGVKMASHILHGAGMRLDLADLCYDDYSAEEGKFKPSKVAGLLLKSFLKSVISNTAGKKVGDKWF